MALSLHSALLSIAAKSSGQSFDQVITLGRQSLRLSHPEIKKIIAHHPNPRSLDIIKPGGWADSFFATLGSSTTKAIDYSNYEGADIIHDMNYPWREGEPPGRFDVVFDGGTLEHIFNIHQALLNVMDLVKVGGCFLSATPVDGWLGHGFHQMQPEIYFRLLCPENGFILRGLWIAEYDRPAHKTRFFMLKDPAITGLRNSIPGARPLVMLAWATKIENIRPSVLSPSQSNYTAMWSSACSGETIKRVNPFIKKTASILLPDAITQWIKIVLHNHRNKNDSRNTYSIVDELKPLF